MISSSTHKISQKATLIGCIAPLAWAFVSVMVVILKAIPPFQLLAMMMATGAIMSFALGRFRKISVKKLFTQPKGFYLVGFFGLFGFFASQFIAFQNADPMEVFILVNLWPLILLTLDYFIVGDVPNRWHIIFSGIGIAGIFIVAYINGFTGFNFENGLGIFLGATAAFFWAFYSVLNHKYASVPLDAIFVVFITVAIAAAVTHVMVEQTVIPDMKELFLITIMGAGPEGLALYAWSYGVQRGDLRILSTVSYLSPILGAILLIILAL